MWQWSLAAGVRGPDPCHVVLECFWSAGGWFVGWNVLRSDMPFQSILINTVLINNLCFIYLELVLL